MSNTNESVRDLITRLTGYSMSGEQIDAVISLLRSRWTDEAALARALATFDGSHDYCAEPSCMADALAAAMEAGA